MEYSTAFNCLRPIGKDYGLEPQLETSQEIEVWSSNQGGPYGWYLARVTKTKKNVVYVSTEEVDMEPMYSRKATRLPNVNKSKVDQVKTIELEVPLYLHSWILSDAGSKLLTRCRERKELHECTADDSGETLHLSGSKDQLDNAINFLKFNFDNLE